MAKVELRNLSKFFDSVRAVNNLNLEINNGEFVTLLGPSGCGKSTTLYCIAGLEEPTSGEILFDGRRVNDLEPRDRDIALVFQEYALYPHMTVEDNLSFPLRIQKFPKKEINSRVNSVIEMLRVTDLLHRRPSELSGGQRQRIALGRAIIRNPVVFLMDEPLSNIDAALRVRMRTEIKNLQRELGVTTIFVTHDQEEAMVLSDRIAILHNGIIQQYDIPIEVYKHPNNLFVASFIGSPSMNFIPGSLELIDDRLVFDLGDYQLKFNTSLLKNSSLTNFPKGQSLLGIRPEDVVIHKKINESYLPAEVFLVELLGSMSYINLLSGDRVLKGIADSATELCIGDQVGLEFPESCVYFFDPQSGEIL